MVGTQLTHLAADVLYAAVVVGTQVAITMTANERRRDAVPAEGGVGPGSGRRPLGGGVR